MDNNTLKFIEIRNSYARPKIGELSINEKALAEYEKFCLDLIKDNEHKKEINQKAIEYIKDLVKDIEQVDCGELWVKNRLKYILHILEDKEV